MCYVTTLAQIISPSASLFDCVVMPVVAAECYSCHSHPPFDEMITVDIYYNYWQYVRRLDEEGVEFDGGGWIIRAHTYCFCTACYRGMVVVRPNVNAGYPTQDDADAAAGH